jgi:GNAT superfamily N-acetyltransferase
MGRWGIGHSAMGRHRRMAGAMAVGQAQGGLDDRHREMAGVCDAVLCGERAMITLQVERVETCWNELFPLAMAHWQGTKTYRRHEPFCPDRDRYMQYNEMGFFHLITAREGGTLVGYFGLYITNSMHSQLKMATEDTFFVHPDYRHGRLALRILKYVESYCQLLGVHELLFSCEIDNETGIQKLLNRLGYEAKIIQFSKHLSSTSADSATTADVGAHDTPQHALTR